MKSLGSLLIVLAVTGLGCKSQPSDWQVIAQQDLTGDGNIETLSIQPSAIKLDSNLTSSYSYAITGLMVTTTDNHTLLTVDETGITSEDGSKVRAAISTQTAYALGLGQGYLFYLVQINDQGQAVSEPLTFKWDATQATWVMGK